MENAARLDRFLPTLEFLAARWSSAGPLLPGFPLLAQGRPVRVEEIAAAAGTETARVERAVDAARCERDAQGRLIDLYGLTLTPTLHRLSIAGRVLFSCCALWAHVIPKLVERTVQVESVDPVRRELVRLSLSPAGLESVGREGRSFSSREPGVPQIRGSSRTSPRPSSTRTRLGGRPAVSRCWTPRAAAEAACPGAGRFTAT